VAGGRQRRKAEGRRLKARLGNQKSDRGRVIGAISDFWFLTSDLHLGNKRSILDGGCLLERAPMQDFLICCFIVVVCALGGWVALSGPATQSRILQRDRKPPASDLD
jgi:hypothetical protein